MLEYVILMISALLWMVATMPRFNVGDRFNLPYFVLGFLLNLAGITTVGDIGLSLFSKLLPYKMQVKSAY